MSDILPGLIIALPFLAAAIIRIPVISRSRLFVDLLSVATAGAVALLAAMACIQGLDDPLIQWIGGWEPRDGTVIGIALVADGLSGGFVALTAILVTTVFLYMWKRHNTMGSFLHMLSLIFLGSFAGFVLSGDFLTMFVFMELMAISSYIITAFKIEDNAPLQAAFNIGIVGTIGAFLFLTGGALIYSITGTPNLAEASMVLDNIEITNEISLAFALLMVGLGLKSGFIPFHFAHIDSHSVAPAPQAGLFGAIYVQVGLYGFARLLYILFDAPEINTDAIRYFLIAGGITTALLAAVMSLFQEHLKRLLAFSSVAHLGIAGTAVGLLGTEALAGAGLYITSHAFVKMALFLTAGVLLHQFGIVNRGHFNCGKEFAPGTENNLKILPVAAILIIGALALAGAPPSGLYGGKTYIEEAASAIQMEWIIYPVYISASLTGAAVLRFMFCLFIAEVKSKPVEVLVQEGSRETHSRGGEFRMTLIPAVLLIIGFVIPLFPDLVGGIETASRQGLDRQRYTELIITGETGSAGFGSGYHLWKSTDLLKGILSALIAIIIGFATARRPEFGSYASGPFSRLRRIHSGHVGDYVVWLMFGAGFSALWMMLFL